MGLFSGLKKAVKKVGNAVKKAVNKAADAVSDVIESVGNGIGDGLSWLGSKIPGVGGVFGWLGDIVSSVTDLVGGIVKWIGGVVGGVLSGIIKVIGGIINLDWDTIADGFGDIISGIFGGLIMVVGKAFALVQVVFTIGRPRPLNKVELRLLALVFHDSIATYNVRVVDGFAGVFSLNSRPFVLGNVIYMKDNNATDNPGVFIHESVHVWQNQHEGALYVAEAIASQWWGVGYDWESEANDGKDWAEFEREAQGKCIEDVFDSGGTTSGASGNGAFFAESDSAQRQFIFNGNDWTTLANDATDVIRGQTPWRISEIFD